ncbi:MAG: 50S ribosomal protein L18Ae [Methanomicrobiaceae archaeon]|nr:50S ribosomal protein L18Ae [Methanomicrobiaceae archaeon]
MAQYEVTGTFKISGEWKTFSKIVGAPNEKQAQERILADLGSKHRLKRNYITVSGVNLVDGE